MWMAKLSKLYMARVNSTYNRRVGFLARRDLAPEGLFCAIGGFVGGGREGEGVV
jgi:hypothetical protein